MKQSEFDVAGRPFRIAVINTHPIQYFSPLYAYLNAQPDLDVTALYMSDHGVELTEDEEFGTSFAWDIDLLSGYPYRFVGDAKGRKVLGAGFWGLADRAMWREVRNGGYDAIWTHGHAHWSNILAILAARSKGIPVFLRGETSNILRRSGLKKYVRHLFHKAVIGLCDQFLAISEVNREYYRSMGVAADRIHKVPYAVDNDRFKQATSISANQREDVRRGLGIMDDRPVILYLSKLQKRKHPEFLIEAAARLRAKGQTPHILFVGTGEMEPELRSRVAELHLPDVHFAGFRNQSELPQIYAAADIFVLPAEQEPFGLVVNEALCAGLPAVVTDEVGAARDLVRDGENGAVVPAADLDAFTAALEPLVRDPEMRRAYGAASRKIMDGHSFVQCVEGIRSAIAHVRQKII